MRTQAKQRTAHDLDTLKAQWRYDPCWDIEDTEGFEAHYDELKAYRFQCQQEWHAEHQRELEAKAEDLGVPGNLKLAQYVLNLEQRLDKMNQALEGVYFR